MHFSHSFLLALLFALNALALTTHHLRNVHQHHAIVARAASPAPVDAPAILRPHRRQNTRRCRSRNSSSPLSSTSSSSSTSTSMSTSTSTSASSSTSSSTSTSTTTSSTATTTTTRAAPLNVQPTTTSRAPAPTTTSTPPPPPPTTRPPPPPPSTTQAPPPPPTTTKPPPTSNLPSFMIGTQTGEITYYDAGLGACGRWNNNGDYIAAVSWKLFDNYPGYDRVNPNANPMCGRTVTLTYQGRSITVALVDRCAACDTTDLDLTPTAFKAIAPAGDGRVRDIHWTWN